MFSSEILTVELAFQLTTCTGSTFAFILTAEQEDLACRMVNDGPVEGAQEEVFTMVRKTILFAVLLTNFPSDVSRTVSTTNNHYRAQWERPTQPANTAVRRAGVNAFDCSVRPAQAWPLLVNKLRIAGAVRSCTCTADGTSRRSRSLSRPQTLGEEELGQL